MSSLVDIIVEALKELLRVLFTPIIDLIVNKSEALASLVVRTRHPNAVFSQPTNGPWPDIYAYYWDTLVPLALFLWALSIGLVILLESMGHLFSSYHRTKLKRRAFSGLLGVLTWWWMAAISLRFVDALTGFIVPDLSQVAFFDSVTFGGLGVLGLVVALGTDLVLFALIGMIYFVREIVLFLFVLLMPLLIVFWIPSVGPFALVARFMKKLAGFYVPFLFMTVPVAILFRLSALLGGSTDPGMGGFGTWLAALVVPFIALVSPFILFWQAGGLFFMADRAARRVSYQRAKGRVVSAKDKGQTAVQKARTLRSNDAGEAGGSTSGGSGATGSGRSRATLSRSSTRGSTDSSGTGGDAIGPTAALDGLRSPDGDVLESSHIDDAPRYLQ
ncbi:MAG: hypothetical protein ABEH59_12355 [Halobacteriales archaeon]